MSKYFKISVFSIALSFIFFTNSYTTSSHAQIGDDNPNQNSVFAIIPESPGANCPNGGSLIAAGLDSNGNGVLNFNEVQQIGYACDGDPGPAGPAGPQGPQGVAGADGAPGAQGPEGPAGPTGATGPQGPAGADGADGAQGPQGETGPAGPQGEQGVAGADGPPGADGQDGAVGPEGPQGPEGVPGLDGPAGADGQAGLDGNDGANCYDVLGDVNNDGEINELDCIGPQGEQGLQGDIGPQGPAGPQGAQGDQGPAGATGPQGPQGDTGPIGATGPAGATGPQGPAGADGTDGQDGEEGPEGPQGPNGISYAQSSTGTIPMNCPDGSIVSDIIFKQDLDGDGVGEASEPTAFIIPGVCDGADGAQGPQGETGPQGPQGQQGLSGFDGTDGADGTNGQSAFILSVKETISPSCPGNIFATDIFIGQDLNGNGQFDIGTEVIDIFQVCDGQDGATGPQGPSGGAGTWSTTFVFTCNDGNTCSSERSCPVGQVLADTSCGFENPPSTNNTWVRFAGRRGNDRTSACDVRNDSNSNNRDYEHAIYCVDE